MKMININTTISIWLVYYTKTVTQRQKGKRSSLEAGKSKILDVKNIGLFALVTSDNDLRLRRETTLSLLCFR